MCNSLVCFVLFLFLLLLPAQGRRGISIFCPGFVRSHVYAVTSQSHTRHDNDIFVHTCYAAMHSSSQAMDVPYNKSGASSRAHYQVVRNVENATDNVEEILLKEVDRIKQRIVQKMVSTVCTDILISLLCL